MENSLDQFLEKIPDVGYIKINQGAKKSGVYLAGESPAMEGEPAPPCSESCVSEGNDRGEA